MNDGAASRLQARQLARPQAMLFDWDNTLVDSWPVIHQSLNATLVAFDKEPWSLEDTRRRVRRSLRDSFPDLFGDRWTMAAEFFYDRFADLHLEALQARPGAGDMLRALQGLGIYLGVVSNKKGEYLRAEAAQLDWSRYFGSIIGALDAPNDKPARDPVDMALADSGFQAGQDVWFVGDTDIDLECAVTAGCVPILVRSDVPLADEFGPFTPAHHVVDCLALCNLVCEL